MNAKLDKTCPVQVATKEMESANIMTVTVGTSCPMGGDSGHGGRTILEFQNEVSTDMRVEINGMDFGNVDSVKLTFGGDSECVTVIDALQFALDRLTTQTKLNAQTSNTAFM